MRGCSRRRGMLSTLHRSSEVKIHLPICVVAERREQRMRINLSIPDDLYNKLKASPSFNWSQVASAALLSAVEHSSFDKLRQLQLENTKLKRRLNRILSICQE